MSACLERTYLVGQFFKWPLAASFYYCSLFIGLDLNLGPLESKATALPSVLPQKSKPPIPTLVKNVNHLSGAGI